jgi:hypothetical protein
MRWHHWAFLLVASMCGHAEAQACSKADTTGVRDTTLPSLRRALAHYDVSACATLAQLDLLAQFADDHTGSAEAEEARFLRAAVASDLTFVAQLRGNAELTGALAKRFGSDPPHLRARIEQALREAARGIYRQPALLAIQTLRDSSGQPGAAPGVRSDALLVRRALNAAKSASPRASLAALGRDPCVAQPCTPDIASLDVESRSSFWYLFQVAEAEARLAKSAALGDPLAEVVQPILREARADLPPASIPFLPDVQTAAIAWTGATAAAPRELHTILFVTATELGYAQVEQARIGAEATRIERPANAFPARKKLADVKRMPSTIKPVAEWVSALQALVAAGSVGVVAAPDVPGHLLARVMASLLQAGAQRTQLLARTDPGQLASVPVQIVFAGLSKAKPADVALRLRQGGYVIRQGQSEAELPRLPGSTRYDSAGLARILHRRRFQSVGVSFASEVTAQALLEALAQLPPSELPVQLLLRNQL